MSTKSIVSRKLQNKITTYLAKKKQLAHAESEAKALKAEIDTELDQVAKDNGFVNGKLELLNAKVSVVWNPARLSWIKTGESLKPIDREAVSLLLPAKFVYQDVRVSDLYDAIERGDNALSGLLASKAIWVNQESRYDIKAIQ